MIEFRGKTEKCKWVYGVPYFLNIIEEEPKDCVHKACIITGVAWEVTKWHDDWHLRGPETKPGKRKLMRAKYHPQSNVICGMRPSYWLPKHQFPCVIPHPSGDGSVIM